MATLEKHDGVYRIDFSFGDKRFRRSLKTDSEKAANSTLARAEDTLRRLTLGQLVLPTGADVATFVLSDGKLEKQQTLAKHTKLGSLLDAYRANVTNLKATTRQRRRTSPQQGGVRRRLRQ
jgi:flavin-binding protein dodecin